MKVFLAVVAFLLATSMAMAADGDSGWYAGVGFGSSSLHNACDYAGSLGLGTTCDDESNGWKVFLGRDFAKYWGLEFSYTDAGEAAIVDDAAPTGTLDVHPRIVAGYGRLRIPLGRQFELFAKAGLTYFDTEYKRTGSLLTAVPENGDDGVGTAIGAGLSWRFWRNFGVRAEWENFNDVSIGDGDVDLATASLIYNF